MLATLQRIASVMDAEEIEAAPRLAVGTATATPEDVLQFLDNAVVPETGKTFSASEGDATIMPSIKCK